jgi:hypothetical protein
MRFKSDDQRRAVFAKKKFYHGSAGFRGRVVGAEGLVPPTKQFNAHVGDEMRGPEFDEFVFLTSDPKLAKTHAERRAIHWEDTEYGPIVYEVELEESEVVPDTFDPVRYPDCFKYKGIIPSEKLKRVKFSKDPKFIVPDNIENPHDYVPVKVNVEKFKEYWERNPDNYFDKDFVATKERYEGIKEEIEKKNKIYMPEVYAKKGPEPDMDSVDVADGRHRSAAIIEKGLDEMKIVVPDYQKEWFEEKMGAK